jgi:hypothetical protein
MATSAKRPLRESFLDAFAKTEGARPVGRLLVGERGSEVVAGVESDTVMAFILDRSTAGGRIGWSVVD